MWTPEHLLDDNGRWSQRGLLEHGITMRTAGRGRHIVTLRGQTVGVVESIAARWDAWYGPNAHLGDAQFKVTGLASIPAAAAWLATQAFNAGLGEPVAGCAGGMSVEARIARGEELRASVIKDPLPEPEPDPTGAALESLEIARGHLVTGDLDAARERMRLASSLSPVGVGARNALARGLRCVHARSMRPHIVRAQEALAPGQGWAARSPSEKAAWVRLDEAGRWHPDRAARDKRSEYSIVRDARESGAEARKAEALYIVNHGYYGTWGLPSSKAKRDKRGALIARWANALGLRLEDAQALSSLRDEVSHCVLMFSACTGESLDSRGLPTMLLEVVPRGNGSFKLRPAGGYLSRGDSLWRAVVGVGGVPSWVHEDIGVPLVS